MLKKDRSDVRLILLIVTLFLFNLLQSATMDLSHDEAYYWIYSLFPAWGYYDHPPMVGWMIYLGTLFGKHEIAVRLPFAFMQAGTLWMLWQLAGRKNFAVFSVSVLSYPLLLGSGFLALPDTPLLFFSVLFWWFAKKYEENDTWTLVPWVALSIACMFYSKYHALIIVLFTTLAMPKVLGRKSFWVIVGLVIVLFLPHVLWQYENDFVSLAFHLGKRAEKHLDMVNILDYLGGQVALGGFFAFPLALFIGLKCGREHKNLLYNSLGFFAFVFLLSLRNKIEANWTVTAFAALTPLLCRSFEDGKVQNIFVGLSSLALIAFLSLRILMMPNYSEGDYPFERMGEVKGWQAKTAEVLELAGDYPLYADTYQVASKLSFYGDALVPSLALGSRESQFSLLNLQANLQKGDKISFAGPKNLERSTEVFAGYKDEIFVSSGISVEELLELYGRSYEETIRN